MKVVVFGGSGLVGSAVCRHAIKRGWLVVSLSRRGQPFVTPSGHTPAWVNQVEWRKGNPFERETFAPLLSEADAVVTTLGILLERSYKSDKGQVNPLAVLGGMMQSVLGDRGNPLRSGKNEQSYETMNRDAPLAIFRALASPYAPEAHAPAPRPIPFVYLSAEDIFRPFVDARYIKTKREAERIIALESAPPTLGRPIRPVFIRPSMIYHPHLSPLSTLPATALDVSSRLQSLLPHPLRLNSHLSTTPSTSSLSSIGNLLSIPPIHVDTVAEAVCRSIEDDSVKRVVDVKTMRRWSGFNERWDQEEESDLHRVDPVNPLARRDATL